MDSKHNKIYRVKDIVESRFQNVRVKYYKILLYVKKLLHYSKISLTIYNSPKKILYELTDLPNVLINMISDYALCDLNIDGIIYSHFSTDMHINGYTRSYIDNVDNVDNVDKYIYILNIAGEYIFDIIIPSDCSCSYIKYYNYKQNRTICLGEITIHQLL